MSLKRSLGVVAFSSAVALALYGVGCGGSGSGSPGGSSGNGGSTGSGGGGTQGHGGGGTKGTGGKGGSGGSGGVNPFPEGGEGGGSCAPGSLTGFTPALNTSAVSAGCTATQISNIVADCFGGNPDAGMNACMDLLKDPGTDTCFKSCVFTSWTMDKSGTSYAKTAWGGIVYLLNPGETNLVDLGGCIAAAAPGDATVQKCATDQEEALECELQACAGNCGVPTPGTGQTCTAASDPACYAAQQALFGCFNAAASGGCKTYADNAMTDCSTIAPDSGPVFDCVNAVNILTGSEEAGAAQFSQAFNQYLDILCLGSLPGGG